MNLSSSSNLIGFLFIVAVSTALLTLAMGVLFSRRLFDPSRKPGPLLFFFDLIIGIGIFSMLAIAAIALTTKAP
jgi:hypothetical protein